VGCLSAGTPVLGRFGPRPRGSGHDGRVDGDSTSTRQGADAGKDRLTAEKLVDYVQRASFAKTLGRRGYQQSEVDGFLVRVADTIRAGEPLAELMRRTHFDTVRLEDGYDTTQVDEFLAAVADLDPHAERPRPEAGRSGLVTKLFG